MKSPSQTYADLDYGVLGGVKAVFASDPKHSWEDFGFRHSHSHAAGKAHWFSLREAAAEQQGPHLAELAQQEASRSSTAGHK